MRTALLRPVALLAAIALASVGTASADETFDSEKARFRVVTLAEGLEHPWGLAFLPGGDMLITERPGRLRLLRDGRLLPQPLDGLPPVARRGQGGLLDVALHPRFAETGWIYLSFAARDEDGYGTRVVRGQLTDQGLSDVETIYDMQPKSGGGRHFGSRLAFDREGFLYVTIGDRGEMQRAQDLGDDAGSVLRLHDDGRIPADNPFVDRPGARPAIFSYGHRNPQGLALNPWSGALWAQEHGARGGDEVNLLRKGANYGWPVITYGIDYSGATIGEGTHKPGMEQPLHYWDPSIAPSGMAFYDGEAFPAWRGDLFIGALKDRLLVRLELDGDRIVHEERLLRGAFGRIRDVRQGPDGLIYLLTDSPDGVLLRLEPVD